MQGLLPCIKWGNIAPLRYDGEPVWRNNQPLLKFNGRAWPFVPFIKGFSNSNIVLISKHVMHLYIVNNNNSIVNCSCSSTPKALRQFCNRCVFESTQPESGSASVLRHTGQQSAFDVSHSPPSQGLWPSESLLPGHAASLSSTGQYENSIVLQMIISNVSLSCQITSWVWNICPWKMAWIGKILFINVLNYVHL